MKHFLITIIAIVSLISCGGAAERKEVYLEKAKQSLDDGDLDKARVELKNVLQIDPKDAQAHFYLGNVFEQQNEYQKAFRHYLSSEEIDPNNLEIQEKMGRFYVLMGDIDKAIEKMNFILSKDSNDVGGLVLKAVISFKQGDVINAKKISQEVFLKHPEHIDNSIFLATLYVNNSEYEDSINVLNRSMAKNPNNLNIKNLLANIYQMAGKNDQAEKLYKTIIDNKPGLYSNYLKLAMLYQRNGKSEQAEELLRNAIEKDQENLEKKMVLVEFYQQTKGKHYAIEILKSFIEGNPGMGKLSLELAKLYFAEDDFNEAEKVLKLAVANFPEDSIGIEARVYLANLYMKMKKIDLATSVIEDAIQISPNDSQVNFVRAKMQLVSQDSEGAIISLRTVIKNEPEKIEAYFLLASAHIANGSDEQADEIINQAYLNNRANKDGLIELTKYHAKNNNKLELGKVVDSALSIDPDNYEALSYKASLLNERKNFSEAKSYTLRIIELYPDMPNGYIQSVPYFLAENEKNEAIALLGDGYKKVKENFQILELLVRLHMSIKNFDEAINKVKSAILEKDESAELYMLQAKIQLSLKNFEEAKISLVKAKDIKSDWNEPYLILAGIYTADKQHQKAIEILEQGLIEVKNDPGIMLGLAKIYESLNDFDAAISVYEKAYENHPANAIVANNLALLLSENRNDENSFKRAKEIADKLRNIDQVVILDTVGWVYFNTGNYAEAVTVLKSVVEKTPNIPVFNYHFGMALYKTGDVVESKNYLNRALSSNKNFRGKNDAEIQLKKLQ